MVHDLESLKKNYKDLKDSLEFTQSQVELLLKENKSLNQLDEDYEEMEQRLSDLESKQDDIEQYTRKFNLEIHGFPENEDEDLADMADSVIKIGELAGVIVTRKNIDIAYRMKRKSRNLPRPIIVRFRSYGFKRKLYNARRNLRNIDFSTVGVESIFINENLTSWRAELFKELRKKQKQRYPDGKAWSIDGKIFIKTNPSTKARRSDSYEDLKDL